MIQLSISMRLSSSQSKLEEEIQSCLTSLITCSRYSACQRNRLSFRSNTAIKVREDCTTEFLDEDQFLLVCSKTDRDGKCSSTTVNSSTTLAHTAARSRQQLCTTFTRLESTCSERKQTSSMPKNF